MTVLTTLHSSPLGNTGEIASWMAGRVAGASAMTIAQAARLPPSGANSLAAPTRYDRWHTPMRQFAARHRAALADRPVAAMFTCLSLSRGGDGARRDAIKYRRRVAEILPGISASGGWLRRRSRGLPLPLAGTATGKGDEGRAGRERGRPPGLADELELASRNLGEARIET